MTAEVPAGPAVAEAVEAAAIEELQRLAEEATPGPWFVDSPLDGGQVYVGNRADGRDYGLWAIVHVSGDNLGDLTEEAARQYLADARFIAAARDGVPALVTALAAARGEVSRLETVNAELRKRPTWDEARAYVADADAEDVADALAEADKYRTERDRLAGQLAKVREAFAAVLELRDKWHGWSGGRHDEHAMWAAACLDALLVKHPEALALASPSTGPAPTEETT